jgi:hypothetical protein
MVESKEGKRGEEYHRLQRQRCRRGISHGSHGPLCLREVSGVTHLGDEAGESDLPDEGIVDVGECVHACNKSSAGGGDGEYNGIPLRISISIKTCRAWLVSGWMIFYACKYCGK